MAVLIYFFQGKINKDNQMPGLGCLPENRAVENIIPTSVQDEPEKKKSLHTERKSTQTHSYVLVLTERKGNKFTLNSLKRDNINFCCFIQPINTNHEAITSLLLHVHNDDI